MSSFTANSLRDFAAHIRKLLTHSLSLCLSSLLRKCRGEMADTGTPFQIDRNRVFIVEIESIGTDEVSRLQESLTTRFTRLRATHENSRCEIIYTPTEKQGQDDHQHHQRRARQVPGP